MEAIGTFIYGTFTDLVINPLLVLLATVALLFFILGIVKMLLNAGNETRITEGKRHMIWSLLGLLVIFSTSKLIDFLRNTSDSLLR